MHLHLAFKKWLCKLRPLARNAEFHQAVDIKGAANLDEQKMHNFFLFQNIKV